MLRIQKVWPAAIMGLVGGGTWLAFPKGSRIPAAIETHLAAPNYENPMFVFDVPPPGTEWEAFTLPLSYAEAARLMREQGGWREVDQVQGSVHRKAFIPERPQEYALVKVAYWGLEDDPDEKKSTFLRAVFTTGFAPTVRRWRDRALAPAPPEEPPVSRIFGCADYPDLRQLEDQRDDKRSLTKPVTSNKSANGRSSAGSVHK